LGEQRDNSGKEVYYVLLNNRKKLYSSDSAVKPLAFHGRYRIDSVQDACKRVFREQEFRAIVVVLAARYFESRSCINEISSYNEIRRRGGSN